MRVEVGPVPSSSVLSWVSYASDVLTADGAALPDDVTDLFRSFLDEWQAIAERSATFQWSTDIALEVAEYVIHAFYRVAQRLADEAELRGSATAPTDGDRFYRLLVRSLLDALAADGGPSGAEFADHLRSFWPGYSSEA